MPQQSTIYIVDDDPGIVESLTHLVTPIGAVVESYSCGEDFLQKFQPTGPACLILDIRMPGMSGLEVQRRLSLAGIATPIIVITGHGDLKMAAESVGRGAMSFWEKPFSPAALLDEIQAAMQKDEEAWRRCGEESSGSLPEFKAVPEVFVSHQP